MILTRLKQAYGNACNSRHGWIMVPLTLLPIGAAFIGLVALLKYLTHS